jgi:hypothetical protein
MANGSEMEWAWNRDKTRLGIDAAFSIPDNG